MKKTLLLFTLLTIAVSSHAQKFEPGPNTAHGLEQLE